MMTSLDQYLSENGSIIVEGYSQQNVKQVETLSKLASLPEVSRIMEIGFNAGHSAEVFLQANPRAIVTSFDIGFHKYIQVGKEYIDNTYPDRHTLILGDSSLTIPRFIKENPGDKFDLIFIDGGHQYIESKTDLVNCSYLSHIGTIVVMDDTAYTSGLQTSWSVGPTKAWVEGMENGYILGLGYEEYSAGRGMSYGKYSLSIDPSCSAIKTPIFSLQF